MFPLHDGNGRDSGLAVSGSKRIVQPELARTIHI